MVQKLKGTKYTWYPGSSKLEGTHLTGAIEWWLRPPVFNFYFILYFNLYILSAIFHVYLG